MEHWRGIVYPSARAPQGLAVSLFGDQSRSLQGIKAALRVKLTLVDRATGQPAIIDSGFDLYRHEFSQRQGHYAFEESDFAIFSHLIEPQLPVSGYVDLV